MTKAIIYKPAKTATQSGKLNTKSWILTYTGDLPQRADSLMGWIGYGATSDQIKLSFPSKEDAISYAQQKCLEFEVREPHLPKFKQKSYAENFTK